MNKKISTPYIRAQEKVLEKEIKETKKYIKKIWGNNIKIKKMSCKEMRELGEELGMNVFGTKKFKSKCFSNRKNKIYMRVCRRCDKYHKIKRNDGTRPRPGYLCMSCKKKVNDIKGEQLILKNQNKWKQKILDVLKNESRFTIPEIAREIKCSTYPVRGALKILSKEKKIKILKVTTIKII